ncbi:hypothetical protein KJ810_01960, partial [Patescibacteria group bacterium]|nr:hypothetical protein [Patescibacteria group bacterium]
DLRGDESKAVVAIPPVVGIVIVGIQPPTITIAVHTEEVRVAIGVTVLYKMPSIPPPIEYSLGCILFGIFNAPAFCTKSFHFLSSHTSRYFYSPTDGQKYSGLYGRWVRQQKTLIFCKLA